ncbi:type IV toxin-antitoxin system AbiEi family antitoxin domain-containing protein [Microbacterium sp. NPDC089180]|uniref:type IV toxin-antitoxin system AbiEi family antitoxin domain-containing protein n=1 Tax=unclassified Microbacterium TaxID=2609290 RepID=UPI003442EEBF
MDAAFELPLLRRAELLEAGIDRHGLDARLRAGVLERVRPGVYVDPQRAASLRPEQWMVVRARALALMCSEAPVFSHQTAAALHGLPVHPPSGERVHLILDEHRRGPIASAVRHRGELQPDEVVERNGLKMTALTRTMADVARTSPFENAVCSLDGALRHTAGRGDGGYDEDAAHALRAAALAISMRSAHGRARAARALAFADGRAQLPGESISRIRLTELGFRSLRLQVPVATPTGGSYYVDFGIEDVNAWGEFDGRGKYVDDGLRGGRTAAEVVLAEKQREDWIRGATGRPVVRWGWPHLRDAATLASRLRAFHIPLP